MTSSKKPKLTPMMEQYHSIKSKHKDMILFFRLGDFYEMFNEDAVTASKELGLVLTKKPAGKGNTVPLAGIPHHSYENYLAKLVKKGYKVAICEQLEDPKDSKGVVKRGVIRIVTPGTVIEDNLLDDKTNNYLASFYSDKTKTGISFIDISTGKFICAEFEDDKEHSNLINEIMKFSPSEILITEETEDDILDSIRAGHHCLFNKIEGWQFDYKTCYERLLEHFKVPTLEGFGCDNYNSAVVSSGILLDYVYETQKLVPSHITKIIPYSINSYVIIDNNSQRNLELVKTIRDSDVEWSLFGVLDCTVLNSGGRLLKEWILQPLKKPEDIIYRQDGVTEFFEKLLLRNKLRELLENIYDIERIVSKISCKKVNPRELISLKVSLEKLPDIKELLKATKSDILSNYYKKIDLCEDIKYLIETSIASNPPITIGDGGVIKKGYNAELDDIREVLHNGKSYIIDMEKREKERTDITSLKIKFNKVFGYYIEVTKANLDKVPENYIRKQTLVNSERFITPELKEFEDKVLDAEEKVLILEENLFNGIRDKIALNIKRLQFAAEILAVLDVLSSLAEIAVLNNYVKPKIDNKGIINVKGSRHPVIEKISTTEKFVSNDICLNRDTDRFLIITGPNMAGKSTYIRQVALNVLMGQMGSYIAAEDGVIGVVDRIFTRVGASDNLVKGQSTFMVEMIETANILNNATEDSLIILDEIGRGTSTYDGVSLAWAISEYINDKKKIGAKTLFATHYHELIELANRMTGVKNYNIAVKEWNDKIIFLFKIEPGGTNRSYGIQVAQLAGVPKQVIEKAKKILYKLENNRATNEDVLPLLQLAEQIDEQQVQSLRNQDNNEIVNSEILKDFIELNINTLTPLDAINKLSDLQQKLKEFIAH